MSWLGEGLSTLRGQITNFTKEVLSDGKSDEQGDEGATGSSVAGEPAISPEASPRPQGWASDKDRHTSTGGSGGSGGSGSTGGGIAEGFFGKALSGLPLSGIPLFGRSEALDDTGQNKTEGTFYSENLNPLEESFESTRPIVTQGLHLKHPSEYQSSDSHYSYGSYGGAPISGETLAHGTQPADEDQVIDSKQWLEQLEQLKRENSELVANMEELNSQQQVAMDRVLQMMNIQQEQYETLKTTNDSLSADYERMKTDLKTQLEINQVLQQEKMELQSALNSSQDNLEDLQKSLAESNEKIALLKADNEHLKSEESASQSEKTSRLEKNFKELLESLKNILPEDIPEEYRAEQKDTKPVTTVDDPEVVNIITSVGAIVTMAADFRHKKETLEIRLGEQARSVRDASIQISTRDKQIAKLEEECMILRENVESLLDGLNVTKDKRVLPAIPETPEAAEDESIPQKFDQMPLDDEETSPANEFSKTVDRLEREINVLQEARLSLETDASRLRSEVQELNSRLRASDALLGNQEHLEKQVRQWQRRCQQLEMLCTSLREADTMREEREATQRGQDSLQAEVSEWKTVADCAARERLEAVRAADALSVQVAELRASLAASESVCSELRENARAKFALEAQVAELHNSLKANSHTLSSTSEELQSCKKNIESLRNDVSIKDEELRKLIAQLQQTEEENESLKLELQSKSLDIENFSSTNNEISEELANLRNELSLLRKEQSQIDSVSLEISDLVEERNRIVSEKESLETHIRELKEQLRCVKESNEDLKKDLKSLQENGANQVEEFEASLSAFKAEAGREIKQLTEALKEHEKCSTVIGVASEARVEVEQLREALREQEERSKLLEASLIEAEAEFHAEVARRREAERQREYSAKMLEGDVSEAEEESRREVVKLQEALREREEYSAGLAKTLDEVQTQAKYEIDELQRSLSERKAYSSQLEASLAEAEAKMKLEVEKLRMQNVVSSKIDVAGRDVSAEGTEQPLEVLTDHEECSSKLEALEAKLKSMFAEKEQIITVLNEKVKDYRTLRTENEKLLAALSQHLPQISTNNDSNGDNNKSDGQLASLTQQLITLQTERENLIATVQAKHNESVIYHNEVLRLTGLLQSKSEERQKAASDDSNKNSQGDLSEYCAQLEVSLQEERTKNVHAQNESKELREKVLSLNKELERLRAHLIETEDTHTAELLRMESEVSDLKNKLAAAEEDLRLSSTKLKSTSIRANQHVETLQGQSKLIGQQRDELQAKLSAAEDRGQKAAAALRNLQAVLEQFQRDKDRDLAALTEKLRCELNASNQKQEELRGEIRVLQNQLAEAKDGLIAAARLGEQLDKKTDTITALKDEVARLQDQLSSAEERVTSASQSVEGKIDKSLTRNLVVGLLSSPDHARLPALRAVAAVLDFNRDDRHRVGLEHADVKPGRNDQSLSEAFVRFLENESRPQFQPRLLHEGNRSNSSPDARRDSRGSSASQGGGNSPIRRSPLLLSDVVLPTLSSLPVGRSSSSILKDVLNNDT